jgi:hypothetical protein
MTRSGTAAFALALGFTLQVAVMFGSATVITSASAAEFDHFRLAPGEASQVQTGATYQSYRICNDLGSPGPLQVAMGDRLAQALKPGECTEDSGDTLHLRNQANGVVWGIYQPFNNSNGGQ